MSNPNTDILLMQALGVVAPAGTRLQSLNGPVLIEDETSLAAGKFPALHIETGPQRHKVISGAVYDGEVRFDLTYFDRWDTQSQTIDQIRSIIRDDLEKMADNIRHNSSLTIGNVFHTISIPVIDYSPYKGEIDYRSCPGLTLVKRILTITVNLLPYDV